MSYKNLDKRGRERNITVGFRVSEQEAKRIDSLVAMSGMTKQDYIVSRLENKDVIVKPSTRIFKGLRDEMRNIYVELLRLRRGQEIDPDLVDILETLTKIYAGMGADEMKSQADSLDEALAHIDADLRLFLH